MAKSISKNICEDMGSELSETLNSNIFTDITGVVDEPSKNTCHCFSEVVSAALADKFTEEELAEIKKDKIKKIMVAKKLIASEDIQKSIIECLKGNFHKTKGDYENFNKSLDKKFDNK